MVMLSQNASNEFVLNVFKGEYVGRYTHRSERSTKCPRAFVVVVVVVSEWLEVEREGVRLYGRRGSLGDKKK
jgi:hypothetical protein